MDALDFVNVSTIWTRLATLYDPGKASEVQLAGLDPPVQEPAFQQFMAQLIGVTTTHLRFFGTRALANVMWAMSNVDWRLEDHEPAVEELVRDWCAAVREHVGQLRAADIDNISTAIGRLDDRWRPDFVVAFYRAVLRREELLADADARTLNNLIFGISRAHRRGLGCAGPSTRALLAQCVMRLLSRHASESGAGGASDGGGATRLEPWRAAQLLYNCHKLRLRITSDSYAVLMPLVAQVYTQEPCPLDRWSLGALTGLVAAQQSVKPEHRPDLRPLYLYVERRSGEATTSQLAMLSHAFRKMGCLPRAPFWGQVFSRYLDAAPSGRADQALSLPRPHPPQLSRPLVLAHVRPQPQPHAAARPRPQHPQHPHHPQQHLHNHQHQHEQQSQQHAQVPSQQREQHQEPAVQQQEAQGQGQGLGSESECGSESPLCPRPKLRRPRQAAQMQHLSLPPAAPLPLQQPQPPGGQDLALPQPEPQAGLVGPESLEFLEPERPQASPSECGDPVEAAHSSAPSAAASAWEGGQGPVQPRDLAPPLHSEQAPRPPTQPQTQPLRNHAVHPPPSTRHAQLQGAGQPREPQPVNGTGCEVRDRPPPCSNGHPGSQQPAEAAVDPPAAEQPPDPTQPQPLTGHRNRHPGPLPPAHTQQAQQDQQPQPQQRPGHVGPKHVLRSAADDGADPRALHFVCWQAAKAGILPPRAFLRLYVARVPAWLDHYASDKQLAQAVETLQLLRWVPRRDMRETLQRALARRAPTSPLPLRRMMRWLDQQR